MEGELRHTECAYYNGSVRSHEPREQQVAAVDHPGDHGEENNERDYAPDATEEVLRFALPVERFFLAQDLLISVVKLGCFLVCLDPGDAGLKCVIELLDLTDG